MNEIERLNDAIRELEYSNGKRAEAIERLKYKIIECNEERMAFEDALKKLTERKNEKP